MSELPLVCAGVIAFGVLMYVLLDGFDLGVGILFPWMPDEAMRDTAIASIATVWDGNETWLIFGGAVLFAAFPTAYAAALPAFYLPIMALLFALIFRGVAFEFRVRATRTRKFWNTAFAGGSTLAAFSQGLLLGGLLSGVKLVDRRFAGGAFDWFGPFPLTVGCGVVGAYALLGATWLNFKTRGRVRDWARRAARMGLLLSALALAVVSVYTPLRFPAVAARWFGDMHWLYLAPIPLATAVVTISLWRELTRGPDWLPFAYAVALFLLGYLGIAISIYPNLLPPDLSVWDASAPPATQEFLLLEVAFTVPMLLIYTGYAYWVFRGKIAEGAGYEH